MASVRLWPARRSEGAPLFTSPHSAAKIVLPLATLNTLSNDGTVQALATMQNGGTVDLVVDVNRYFAP